MNTLITYFHVHMKKEELYENFHFEPEKLSKSEK